MDDLISNQFILLQPVRNAVGKIGKIRKREYISKGELLAEIPKQEQVKQEEGTPPHNYRLIRDPTVTLYNNGTGVSPLIGPEGDYLEGIKDPVTRLVEYQKEGRLQWIMGLRQGDKVFFKLERDKGSQASLYPRGRVRYYGKVEGEKGVMFGIEITEPEHRGKGTTNGQPYFKCNHRDGVFVSMDKIIKSTNKPEPIIKKPKPRVKSSRNTHSKVSVDEEDKESWVDKAARENELEKQHSQDQEFFQLPADPQYSASINTTLPAVPSDPSHFTLGALVQVEGLGEPVYGILRWLGILPGYDGLYAGVEMECYFEKCSDGDFEGVRYFNCPPGRGLFCLVSALRHFRYLEPNQVPTTKREDLGNPLASKVPVSEEDYIPGDPVLFSKYIGDEHGIQGHHNSCYLDATVFGLFALSDSFDEMFLEEPQLEIGLKIKNILFKGIVNPLRKYGLARYESIMMLRNELENLGRMKGANKDEKDPEEFLNMLFKEILHVDPFISIKRPFGVEEEFFVQLFFEIDPNQSTLPSTEQLIRKMFTEQQIAFTSVPSKLLLLMPQIINEFKMYNKIIPSLELDVLPLLDPASRGVQQCHLCSKCMGTVCCSTCATDLSHTKESSLFLCKECSELVHQRQCDHKFEEVKNKQPMADVSLFSKMQLLTVICIEISHYVCFTRTEDKWLFHDSMANRLDDTYNIPRVTDVSQELNHWVYDPKNHKRLMQAPSEDVPECVTRFTQDIYVCLYINPNLDRYSLPKEMSLYDIMNVPLSKAAMKDSQDTSVIEKDDSKPQLLLKLQEEISHLQSQLKMVRNENQSLCREKALDKEEFKVFKNNHEMLFKALQEEISDLQSQVKKMRNENQSL